MNFGGSALGGYAKTSVELLPSFPEDWKLNISGSAHIGCEL